MIAVVVILRTMQDKPMDHWTFFVGLNAVIAVFITAAKSTAMLSVAACIGQWKWVYFTSKSRRLLDIDIIEEASRGPLGSLLMIATIPWGWATLGAIITVLGLGIDTFAQQVISTEAVTDWVNDGTAGFKIVHDYITDTHVGADGNTPDPYTVDVSMQGAVVKAFYELDSPSIFSCASNCTWNQTYTSLGFSSSCINVTQATYATQRCNGVSPRNCTMTTPGNVTFSTAIIPTTWSTVLVIKAMSLISDGSSPPYEPSPRSLASFVRLAAFRQPSDYRARSDGALEQTLECDISLVAYKYSNASSIANNFTFGSVEKVQLEAGYLLSPNSYNPTILFNTTGLPEFRITTLDLIALRDYFTSDSFSGTLVDGEEVPAFSQGITAAIRSPKKNISSLLDSMALSMTDQLRTSPNATIAPGLTAKSVLLVRIQWAWLVLPFFVVLASAAFLIAEMAESGRTRDVMLWKSTATSMLFHSIKPAEGVMRMDVQSPKQLQEMVKNTSVKLEHLSHIK
ncbi:hypothetical protein N8I77_009650 [Diaporthe amygdali]|uniref:Uncharacterized protein n=1 Tax=Phomopsis amygdali TaxID=1214568 RepID=A0AAD9W3D7_PHOAM|nr:hypothetical protein N8I77_009650 [Diaporthe amygdali]